MKYVANIFRVLVGALFIFSGSVKAIDPLGTSYKMHDYFSAFSYDFEFLSGLMNFMTEQSLFLAVFMIVFEIVLGVMLLIGWKSKLTSWLLLGMVAFFTLLTGYTYLSGYVDDGKFTFTFIEENMKVTDCGCFGDFLKLHPKESFFKDVVLSIMIIFILIGSKHIKSLFKDGIAGGITGGVTLLSLLFCFSNYMWGLPKADFRPYMIGNHIPTLMEAEKEPDVEYYFVYKNKETGEEKEFDMNSMGDVDKETWEFVDRTEKVLAPGIPAKIINFFVENDEGEDMNVDILYNEDFSFMVVAYDLTKTKTKAYGKVNALAKEADKNNLDFYAITNTPNPDKENFRHEYQTAYPFYFADGTFLKTIIRSNPGILLLKNGTVVDKWHHSKLPSFAEIDAEHGLTK